MFLKKRRTKQKQMSYVHSILKIMNKHLNLSVVHSILKIMNKHLQSKKCNSYFKKKKTSKTSFYWKQVKDYFF